MEGDTSTDLVPEFTRFGFVLLLESAAHRHHESWENSLLKEAESSQL
jgi:hypothetical protein